MMTVRQLITLLSNYPPDAKVDIIDGVPDGEDGFEYRRISCVGSDEQVMSVVPGTAASGLVVDESQLEFDGGAFRRGALEQLFDGASTGLDS